MSRQAVPVWNYARSVEGAARGGTPRRTRRTAGGPGPFARGGDPDQRPSWACTAVADRYPGISTVSTMYTVALEVPMLPQTTSALSLTR